MKKLTLSLTTLSILLMTNIYAFAQSVPEKVDVDIDLDKTPDASNWMSMSNPLVWIVGALILVIIIAVVARSGGSKNA